LVLASLPLLGTVLKGLYYSTSFVPRAQPAAYGSLDVELLDLIFDDFSDEGLLKDDDKALLVNSPIPNGFDNEIHVLMDSDSERKRLIADESYDFVFTNGAIDAEFIDRVLKINGIVAYPFGAKQLNYAFRAQTNYRVVHILRYGFVIVALKKTGPASRLVDSDSSPERNLLATETKAKSKVVALEGLEDVHLEPPRKAWVKSRKYLNNIKDLPDL